MRRNGFPLAVVDDDKHSSAPRASYGTIGDSPVINPKSGNSLTIDPRQTCRVNLPKSQTFRSNNSILSPKEPAAATFDRVVARPVNQEQQRAGHVGETHNVDPTWEAHPCPPPSRLPLQPAAPDPNGAYSTSSNYHSFDESALTQRTPTSGNRAQAHDDHSSAHSSETYAAETLPDTSSNPGCCSGVHIITSEFGNGLQLDSGKHNHHICCHLINDICSYLGGRERDNREDVAKLAAIIIQVIQNATFSQMVPNGPTKNAPTELPIYGNEDTTASSSPKYIEENRGYIRQNEVSEAYPQGPTPRRPIAFTSTSGDFSNDNADELYDIHAVLADRHPHSNGRVDSGGHDNTLFPSAAVEIQSADTARAPAKHNIATPAYYSQQFEGESHREQGVYDMGFNNSLSSAFGMEAQNSVWGFTESNPFTQVQIDTSIEYADTTPMQGIISPKSKNDAGSGQANSYDRGPPLHTYERAAASHHARPVASNGQVLAPNDPAACDPRQDRSEFDEYSQPPAKAFQQSIPHGYQANIPNSGRSMITQKFTQNNYTRPRVENSYQPAITNQQYQPPTNINYSHYVGGQTMEPRSTQSSSNLKNYQSPVFHQYPQPFGPVQGNHSYSGTHGLMIQATIKGDKAVNTIEYLYDSEALVDMYYSDYPVECIPYSCIWK
ncbi:hypothetical protein BDN72DRAFT_864992 [Pluteus cervinus]|uniref:Uncharacterized protein n=1 Tax=Pluteus cervinus TaxID=181527 RepID=A0ACD3A1P6_9AGAR|nr:hypothetical protein BDN72DRAFT_864992 [Pluteus cervinus]